MKTLQHYFILLLNPVSDVTAKIPESIRNGIIGFCFALIFFIHIFKFSLLKNPDLGHITSAEQAGLACIPLLMIILMSIDGRMMATSHNRLLSVLWNVCGLIIFFISFIHSVGNGGRMLALSMVIVYPCLYFIWANRGDYEKLFEVVCKSIAGLGGLFFLYHILFVGFNDTEIFYGIRYTGIVANPNHIGVISAVVIVSCLFLIAMQRKHWYVYVVIGGIANAFAVFAISRTSMVSNIVVTIAFVFYYLKMERNEEKIDRKLLRILLTLIIFLSCAIIAAQITNSWNNDIKQSGILTVAFDNVYLTAQNDNTGSDILSDSVSSRMSVEGKDLNELSSGRIELWKTYVKELNLLGNDEIPIKEVGLASHNAPLEIGYRTGIINGIIFLMIEIITGIYALRFLFNRKYKEPFYLFSILSIFSFGVYSMLETSIFPFYRPEVFMYYIGIAPLFFKRQACNE